MSIGKRVAVNAKIRFPSVALAFVLVWAAGTTTALAQSTATYYVNGGAGNDVWDGLSALWDGVHGPKATIQAAIDAAAEGDTVIVADGTYRGEGNRDIQLSGKALTIRSQNGPESCIIDCEYLGRGFCVDQITQGLVLLEGFTITTGWAARGGAIYCHEAALTVTNCIISQNIASSFGGGIYCEGDAEELCQPHITHNIITANTASGPGGGIGVYYNVYPVVANNIIAANTSKAWGGGIAAFTVGAAALIERNTIVRNSAPIGGGIALQAALNALITNSIVWDNEAPDGPQIALRQFGDIYPSGLFLDYCDVAAGKEGVFLEPACSLTWGNGNLNAEPLFASEGYWQGNTWINGDYHLKSQQARWSPIHQQWVADSITSRCIDAGNPGSPVGQEDFHPSNVRLNLGAYGGAIQTSQPPPNWSRRADLNNDGMVNLQDFSPFAYWLTAGAELPGDLNRDAIVDVHDLVLMTADWLKVTIWHGAPLNWPLLADLNGDERVNLADFAAFAADWLSPAASAGDFNLDGRVDVTDLLVLQESWLN